MFPRPLIRRSCDRRAKMRQSIPIFWIGRLTLVIRSTNRLRTAPHSRRRGPCRCPTILTGQRVRLRTGPHRHHHSRHRQIRAGLVVKLRRSTLRGRRLSRLLQSRGPSLQPPGQPIPTTPCRTQRSRASPYVTFINQLAGSAGLPEGLLAQKDPEELAQQIGMVLGLLAENLMQLLKARQQAKRLARSSSHTIIQPTDNNPLKFCPSAGDALRIMFGPKSAGYLDLHRAIGQGFEDLKSHQIRTYSAMQHALERFIGDLDPKTIERETDAGGGIGNLLQPRKAKLWEAYEARWQAKVGRKSGEAIETFMRYFGEYYDRDGG